jgi:hypothetical protein
MEVLHLSEDQAYLRIAVARLAQKFPVVLEMLADGLVHLTAVHRLGPSLTQENHLSVLEEATYKSMAKVEEMVARLRPQPAVTSRIRKLTDVGQKPGERLFGSEEPSAGGPDLDAQDDQTGQSRHRRSVVSPLAPDLYDVHFTADKETVDALKLLQELLSHQVPSGRRRTGPLPAHPFRGEARGLGTGPGSLRVHGPERPVVFRTEMDRISPCYSVLLFGKVTRKSKAWALSGTTRFKTSGPKTGPSTDVGAGG